MISGHMIAQNLNKYHFPWKEAILSVLPICGEFIICEGYSEDDTYESLLKMQTEYPDKIKIFREKWDTPNYYILSEMTNLCIENCSGDWQWQVQADEVYHEKELPLIKKETEMKGIDFFRISFYHFWSNSFDKILKSKAKAGDIRARLARKSCYPNIYSYGDAFSLFVRGRRGGKFLEGVHCYHYSYTRKPELEKIKATDMLSKWWGGPDKRYNGDKPLVYKELHPDDDCLPFTGTHPAVMTNWINEHKER